MTNPSDITPAVPASSAPAPQQPPLIHPWLVAAWPGMGGVAAIAATHLVSALEARPLGFVPERDFFAIDHVDVQGGIARTGRLPRSMFFVWRDPKGRHDLVIFIGEAQPNQRGYQLCKRILDVAQAHGVERVVTFAAMASGLHPNDAPRVFGAVTAPDLLDPMRAEGIEPLREGQISGLNGALLAAAAERGVPGICLLGEMPFFAAGAPNPKASSAALAAFNRIAGLDVDLAALDQQAASMQGHLTQLFEQLRRQQALLQGSATPTDEETGPEPGEEPDQDGSAHEGSAPNDAGLVAEAPATGGDVPARGATPTLDASVQRRIEDLFERAAADRNQAFALKAELDRLGAFAKYEDRFLDLFRKAE